MRIDVPHTIRLVVDGKGIDLALGLVGVAVLVFVAVFFCSGRT